MNMKNLLIVLILTISVGVKAQTNKIIGSLKVIEKKIELSDFNKINVLKLNDKVDVVVGDDFDIQLKINENLVDYLKFTVSDNTLIISGSDQLKKDYLEKSKISIQVTLPQLVSIDHSGNGVFDAKGISASELTINKKGNGAMFLEGIAKNLTIQVTGNGALYAKDLKSENVMVQKDGNGAVFINTDQEFIAKLKGNGSLINSGNGKSSKQSVNSGNGSIQTK